ncbi:MAG TPA: pirin family protein [Actinomycetales bacterium]|nr:pirin family protein [Actinomycetales bacterium]
MTNPEARPHEIICRDQPSGGVELVEPRDVPLGGPRAMRVRRTLPTRQRSLIGAWCFLDHYGPEDVAVSGGMNVPVHPHTGLQTVSWLFTGEIEHRDSAGHHAFVRPGELNLMTAGSGISHSERSTRSVSVLHGVQLWVALPEHARFTERTFDHYVPPVLTGDGWSGQVFLGALLGDVSPVRTWTPLVGAELRLEPGASFPVEVEPAFEHGVLVDSGRVTVAGREVAQGQLAYVPGGADVLTLENAAEPARLVVLGGPPFGEQIVMWWNFVGRSHDEIVRYRAAWGDEVGGRGGDGRPMFALPEGDPEAPLPAPVLPNARIRPRS